MPLPATYHTTSGIAPNATEQVKLTHYSKEIDMNKVARKDLTNIAMVCGKEKEISQVIDNGVVKEWVGIGWIELRAATEEDYKTIPEGEELCDSVAI